MVKTFTPFDHKAHLRDLLLRPSFMMCRPTYFDPTLDAHGGEGANDYFNNNPFHRHEAVSQWNTGVNLIKELGGDVWPVQPKAGLLDQIYTADPQAFLTDVTLKNGRLEKITHRSLVSKFTNAARNAEIEEHIRASNSFSAQLKGSAQALGILTDCHRELSQFNIEGSGDNVYDPFRGIWWSGFVDNLGDPTVGRSDKRSHAQLSRLTDRPVMSLEVQHPYYHIDTSHTPLPKGHILSYKDGISSESFELMRRVAFTNFNLPEENYLIEVDADDAAILGCNLTVFDRENLIVCDKISNRLQDQLTEAGYYIHLRNFDTARRAGGLWHCTQNRINIMGPKGGTIANPQYYEQISAALS